MEEDLQLGKLLMQSGHLREEVLNALLAEQERLAKDGAQAPRLGQLLVARGIVPPDVVQAAQSAGGSRTPLRAAVPTVSPTMKPGETGRTLLGGAADGEAEGLRPGAQFGRYEILEVVGRGGMGQVYRARDTELGREVALKLMIGGLGASTDEAERFRREATAVASLTHPGIVALYEFGSSDGRLFFSMEFVHGKSLDRVLKEQRFDVERALMLVRETALALHHAHLHGLIHRDIKPSNILLDGAGRPHITDFGLARRVEGEEGLTVSGDILGTPAYMPPEQARGDVREVDVRSDVYCLGGVLYECLTLQHPHSGRTLVEVITQAAQSDPVPPRRYVPRLPRDVETICLKALARTPERRYQSAAELADDIDRFLRKEPIRARPPSVAYRTLRWTQRNRVLAALLAVSIGVGGPLAAWFATRPGIVEVKTSWQGRPFRPTQVLVGGRSLPLTPIGARGEVPSGTHAVSIHADGYVDQQRVVEVRRRGEHEISVAMEHEKGTFDLEVEPSGSHIWLDGADYGSRLRSLSIDTGRHDLLIRNEGRHDVRLSWEARAGETMKGFTYLPPATVFSVEESGANNGFLWFGDVTGDGRQEILHHYFTQFSLYDPWTGRTVWDFPPPPGQILHAGFADLDGDGSLDGVGVLALGAQRVLVAWPGVNPVEPGGKIHDLWHVTETPPGAGTLVSPLGPPAFLDLDDDGGPDVIFASLWMNVVSAYSGKDGHLLWTSPIPGRSVQCIPGKGAKEGEPRLFVVALDAVYSLNPRTGRILWRTPVPVAGADPKGEEFTATVSERALYNGSWDRALPLAGGPGDDLLVPCWMDDAAGTVRLRAFRGEDGTQMWEGPECAAVHWQQGSVQQTARSGRVVILVQTPCGDKANHWTASLLEGKDGKAILHREGDGPFGILQWRDRSLSLLQTHEKELNLWSLPDESPQMTVHVPAPIAGGPSIVDWTGTDEEDLVVGCADSSLHAFNREGRLVGSCLLGAPPRWIIPGGDADGDGFDDLYVECEGPTVVTCPRMQWSYKATEAIKDTPICGDFTGGGRVEVAVFASVPGEGQLLVIDAATGAIRYRARGTSIASLTPFPRSGGGWDLLSVARNVPGGDFDLVRYSGKDGSILRQQHFTECYTPPAVGDLDGDGRPSVLLVSWQGEHKLAALDAETWKEKWTYTGDALGGWVAPLVLEVPGLPGKSVLAGFNDGRLALLSGKDGSRRWSVELGMPVRGGVAVGDVDGSGSLEVLASAAGKGSYDLVCLGAKDGHELWRATGEGGQVMPLIHDMQGHGRSDIFAGTLENGVVCLRADGSVRWRYGPKRPDGKLWGAQARLALADLHGDGRLELLATMADGTLRVLDAATGELEWSFWTGKPEIMGGAVPVDVDGDGVMEVLLAASDRNLYCLKTPPRKKR